MKTVERSADEHPFIVLGLGPRADSAQVKRAYFAKLAQHPPHADPEGFRRLRSAYEAVSTPSGLQRAQVSAPPDVAAELARWDARFGAALQAAPAFAEPGTDASVSQQFTEGVSRLTLAEALLAFADEPGGAAR